jgi:hypothetical protein
MTEFEVGDRVVLAAMDGADAAAGVVRDTDHGRSGGRS